MSAEPASALGEALQAFLVAQGFPNDNVNAVGKNQMTPLMQAAHLGPPAIVAELLAAGARVDAMNADGSQPLWLASVGDDPEIVALIIKAGADISNIRMSMARPRSCMRPRPAKPRRSPFCSRPAPI
ncbi:MAG: ankyrin repeat domain-containing protein [Methylovirgula sp.]